jgi:hypothetical protein
VKDRALVELRHAAYAGDELHTILCTLAGLESGSVCNALAVLVVHDPAGGHELRVLSDGQRGPGGIAALLRHAADHCHGGCRRCARDARKGGNHATG